MAISDLDMSNLLDKSLNTACYAQINLSNATADFINKVGFYENGKAEV